MISGPMNKVSTISAMAAARHPRAARQTPRGDRNDIEKMIAAARPRNRNWRLAK